MKIYLSNSYFFFCDLVNWFSDLIAGIHCVIAFLAHYHLKYYYIIKYKGYVLSVRMYLFVFPPACSQASIQQVLRNEKNAQLLFRVFKDGSVEFEVGILKLGSVSWKNWPTHARNLKYPARQHLVHMNAQRPPLNKETFSSQLASSRGVHGNTGISLEVCQIRASVFTLQNVSCLISPLTQSSQLLLKCLYLICRPLLNVKPCAHGNDLHFCFKMSWFERVTLELLFFPWLNFD